jgi:hypothetical protein
MRPYAMGSTKVGAKPTFKHRLAAVNKELWSVLSLFIIAALLNWRRSRQKPVRALVHRARRHSLLRLPALGNEKLLWPIIAELPEKDRQTLALLLRRAHHAGDRRRTGHQRIAGFTDSQHGRAAPAHAPAGVDGPPKRRIEARLSRSDRFLRKEFLETRVSEGVQRGLVRIVCSGSTRSRFVPCGAVRRKELSGPSAKTRPRKTRRSPGMAA